MSPFWKLSPIPRVFVTNNTVHYTIHKAWCTANGKTNLCLLSRVLHILAFQFMNGSHRYNRKGQKNERDTGRKVLRTLQHTDMFSTHPESQLEAVKVAFMHQLCGQEGIFHHCHSTSMFAPRPSQLSVVWWTCFPVPSTKHKSLAGVFCT